MGKKGLTSLERDVLKKTADLNEKIALTVYERNNSFLYLSILLDVNFKEKYIIIDEASIETPNAKPISKGENFEAFFEINGFRYLFHSQVLEHTKFRINNRGIYALKISLPTELKDGERREYFRVPLPLKPPIIVGFNIKKRGEDELIMSSILENQPEHFEGVMIDISGGGFSIKEVEGSKDLGRTLGKGDVINAKFKLEDSIGEMEIYSQVRNKHKYKDSEVVIWGFTFIQDERNKHIKKYRNIIMRYVTRRQRELMSLS